MAHAAPAPDRAGAGAEVRAAAEAEAARLGASGATWV
jgi:hypothetical protein